jgi:integrase
MWHFYNFNKNTFMQHYHKRSNAETVFSMIKAKFGASVKAKTPTAQVTGLRGIRLHDARYTTHASLMLKQGVHPKIVQERLGHSSIAVTLDTYSHVAPGLQRAAAERFDEALKSSLNNKATEKIY